MALRLDLGPKGNAALKRLAEEDAERTGERPNITGLIRSWLLEKWDEAYPNMMFPNEKGQILPVKKYDPSSKV